MDGLIEQLKETARGIEKRREDLKEAGYNVGRAIRILEDGDDLVRVEIQEKKLERSGRGLETHKPTGKAALMERLEDPDPDPAKVEETTEQPHQEPLPHRIKPTETRPTSQQMGQGPTMYRDVSTRTAILDVLDKSQAPADAKEIHLRLVEGGWTCGGDKPIASVRAALSSMRFEDISQTKIKIGPRMIAHYSLPTLEQLSR